MKLTEDRVKEFEMLRELVREVQNINNASNIISRLARCIELAETLSKTDYRTSRESFMSFLLDKLFKQKEEQP